jgi:hypothetical protein
VIWSLDVAYGSKGEILAVSHAFRFTPESGLNSDIAAYLKSTTLRHTTVVRVNRGSKPGPTAKEPAIIVREPADARNLQSFGSE